MSSSKTTPTLTVEHDTRVAQAKDHALRQLAHLRREIDYDYPAATLRGTRAAAQMAVSDYFRVLDIRARAERAARRARKEQT